MVEGGTEGSEIDVCHFLIDPHVTIWLNEIPNLGNGGAIAFTIRCFSIWLISDTWTSPCMVKWGCFSILEIVIYDSLEQYVCLDNNRVSRL